MSHLPSWSEFQLLATRIAALVSTDGLPDLIVCIQRGGLVPAVLLAHTLQLRTLLPISITRTTSDNVDAPKTDPVVEKNPLIESVRSKDVLLVDDVVGNGATIREAQRLVRGNHPSRLRTAACIVNRTNWYKSNTSPPSAVVTYIGEEIDGWVVFPWERQVT